VTLLVHAAVVDAPRLNRDFNQTGMSTDDYFLPSLDFFRKTPFNSLCMRALRPYECVQDKPSKLTKRESYEIERLFTVFSQPTVGRLVGLLLSCLCEQSCVDDFGFTVVHLAIPAISRLHRSR